MIEGVFKLSELVSRGHLVLSDGYRTRSDQLGNGGIPILRVADVLDGRIEPSFKDHIVESYRPKMGLKISQAGDVLITTKGTVGRVAQVPNAFPEHSYSPQLCFLRSTNPAILDSGWLYQWARSPEFLDQIGIVKDQTDMAPYVSLTDLRNVELSLPPLDQQRRIAGVLGALDDLIDTNRTQFVRLAELQAVRFLYSWKGETRRLGSVAQITMGQSPPGTSYNETGDGMTFYQGTRDFGWRFPTRRVWTTAPTRTAEAGDILVAVRAPVGETNVAVEPTALGRGLAGVRAPERQATLLQALTVDPGIWNLHQGTGTVFAAINKQGLNDLQVPWVDDDDLERELSALDTAIRELSEENAELTRTRDELLPLLMSGKVRVRESLAVA